MHESIREGLEDYLKDPAGRIPPGFHAHIQACEDCATELRLLQAQAQLLRSLQPAAEIEPRAGFYGRVMERIEDQRRGSVWSIFLEPAFGRRLAWTSAAAVLALGTYLVTAELTEPQIAEAPSAIAQSLPSVEVRATNAPAATAEGSAPADNVRQQQRRNALLVNLASFRQ